jgi:hypothetical protein
MAIPNLPHRLAGSSLIKPLYEEWKAKVLAEGQDEAEINLEFFKVMKPRWIQQQKHNDKFEAETEKLRKKNDAWHTSTEHLRSSKQHRFAIPLSLAASTLSPLEVLIYGSKDGHPPYNKLRLLPHVPPEPPAARTGMGEHHKHGQAGLHLLCLASEQELHLCGGGQHGPQLRMRYLPYDEMSLKRLQMAGHNLRLSASSPSVGG